MNFYFLKHFNTFCTTHTHNSYINNMVFSNLRQKKEDL